MPNYREALPRVKAVDMRKISTMFGGRDADRLSADPGDGAEDSGLTALTLHGVRATGGLEARASTIWINLGMIGTNYPWSAVFDWH